MGQKPELKMDGDQVRQMRALHDAAPSLPWDFLASIWGVSSKHAYRICVGKLREKEGGYIDEPPEPTNVHERCPTCGGMVLMPCELCKQRAEAGSQPKRTLRVGEKPGVESSGEMAVASVGDGGNNDLTEIVRPQPQAKPMSKSTALRIAAYLRVSTAGQNEAGQRLAIEQWLKQYPSAIVTWYSDKETGDHLERPAFRRLQDAVDAHEVDVIVVFKLDRISRKMISGLNALARWCKKGIRVVSVTQQLDFSGSVGQMIAAVLFAVAQMEQETRRERQTIGIQAAKARGVYKGRKPNPHRRRKLRERIIELAKTLKQSEIAAALDITDRTVRRYLTEARSA